MLPSEAPEGAPQQLEADRLHAGRAPGPTADAHAGRCPQAFPDNAARREVESLPAICSNDGCAWKGTLKEYEVGCLPPCGATASMSVRGQPPHSLGPVGPAAWPRVPSVDPWTGAACHGVPVGRVLVGSAGSPDGSVLPLDGAGAGNTPGRLLVCPGAQGASPQPVSAARSLCLQHAGPAMGVEAEVPRLSRSRPLSLLLLILS